MQAFEIIGGILLILMAIAIIIMVLMQEGKGGGASALVGAAGVALGSMVGSLTVGKKIYAAVDAYIIALIVRAEALRDQVSQLDAAAQEETSAMAVLENSLSHDKQTLVRLDRELADMDECLPH